MYRSHTCGELRRENAGQEVVLSGWVQRIRQMGGMVFLELRDRYGLTQLAFNDGWDQDLLEQARQLGREWVVQVWGAVLIRESANPQLPTGEIEIKVSQLKVLSRAKTPPFTIERDTDGGEEQRLVFRYLDLRRPDMRDNLLLRSRVDQLVREYLNEEGFLNIETPYLIKSTPEGARDFVVPSRTNPGQFYALPQSPQTFKQLLMVAGYDRYYQIVRCFRDEDLRADRQPEFTQIDCEMSFVDREAVMRTFEGLTRHLLQKVAGWEGGTFPVMTYQEALAQYGTDKPDIRFDMRLHTLDALAKDRGFAVFDRAETVVGLAVPGAADYSRKQLDALSKWVQRPQIGAGGLIWCKVQEEGQFKSSVDKFFDAAALAQWAVQCGAKSGDLILVLAGDRSKTLKAAGELRLHLAAEMGLRDPRVFAPLWVVDFPLLEWDEESGRYHAMHHPFTAPKEEDLHLLKDYPEKARANAYDLVLNGNEIGGGSIRIHERDLQQRVFQALGFSDEEAKRQFGFLLQAFEYGAPPHGGIAFGFDRLVALLGGSESIRPFIPFPKNNAGRDLMLNAPADLDEEQLRELSLALALKAKD